MTEDLERRIAFISAPTRKTYEEARRVIEYGRELRKEGYEIIPSLNDIHSNEEESLPLYIENLNGVHSAGEIHIYWKTGCLEKYLIFGMAFMEEKPVHIFLEDTGEGNIEVETENDLDMAILDYAGIDSSDEHERIAKNELGYLKSNRQAMINPNAKIIAIEFENNAWGITNAGMALMAGKHIELENRGEVESMRTKGKSIANMILELDKYYWSR